MIDWCFTWNESIHWGPLDIQHRGPLFMWFLFRMACGHQIFCPSVADAQTLAYGRSFWGGQTCWKCKRKEEG